MGIEALVGARIFTGERFLDDHAVLLDGARIADVVPEAEVPPDAWRVDLGPGTLAPGFLDAQVNGGGGVLFNETPTAAGAAAVAAAHARFGVTGCLLTFITDRPERRAAAVAGLREALAGHAPGVLGIHLEGPFLARTRKGAHDPALIVPMTDADVDALLGSGIGTLLLTVAAEAGARGVTHLFNAMSPLAHRAPGVVGAAFDHGGLWCGLIADGIHVHPAALRMALRAKRGPGRLFLVSDAMSPTGTPGDRFTLSGRTVLRRDGALSFEDGTLAGADLTLDAAVRYAVRHLEVPLAEALRMASLYPAEFLRLERERGRIAPGFRADLVLLDATLDVRRVWIGGVDAGG